MRHTFNSKGTKAGLNLDLSKAKKTNRVIKKDHIHIKTIFTIETTIIDYPYHYRSPEEGVKSKTRVKQKFMK